MSDRERLILSVIDPERPVVFLDLDGVVSDLGICHLDYVDRSLLLSFPAKHPLMGNIFFRPALAMLKHVLMEVDAQVLIVSSMGRLSYRLMVEAADDSALKAIGEVFGSEVDIVGTLQVGGDERRAEAVYHCVTTLDLTRWVVIDDAYENMYASSLHGDFFSEETNFVKPHGRYGFGTQEHEKTLLRLQPSTVNVSHRRWLSELKK